MNTSTNSWKSYYRKNNFPPCNYMKPWTGDRKNNWLLCLFHDRFWKLFWCLLFYSLISSSEDKINNQNQSWKRQTNLISLRELRDLIMVKLNNIRIFCLEEDTVVRQSCLENLYKPAAICSQVDEALIGLYYNWAMKENKEIPTKHFRC